MSQPMDKTRIRTDQQSTFDSAYSAEVREWQGTLLSGVLNILFIVAIPALVVASYYVLQDDRGWLIPFYVAGFVFVGAVRFWEKAPYALKTGTLLAITYALALLSMVRGGLSSNVRIFLVGMSFIATIFLGRRASFVSLIVTVATMAVGGWIFTSGQVMIDPGIQLITDKPAAWLSYSVTLLMVSVFFVASQNYLISRLAEALAQSRELVQVHEADRIQAERDTEQKRQQAEMLAWAARLGTVLASLRQRNDIAGRVVHEIMEAFDVCQVNLFLTDNTGETLTLAATTGEGSESLAQEGWELTVGYRFLPSRAVQIGREQMTLLSGDDPFYPPSSRIEMSLPLSVRGQVLGVLDIHSALSSFADDTLQLFRIVAGYVTSALDMVQVLEESEVRMQEMRALYAQYTLASWRTLVETGEKLAFATGIVDEQAVTLLAAEVLQSMEPRSQRLDDADAYLLVVPLIARDIALGYLAFTRSAGKGDWTVEDYALIGRAAGRLAITLDNTRLLMEARRQMFYDERLGRLSDLIWQTPNTETIMELSVRELGRFLGASDVQLNLVSARVARHGTQPLPPANDREVGAK